MTEFSFNNTSDRILPDSSCFCIVNCRVAARNISSLQAAPQTMQQRPLAPTFQGSRRLFCSPLCAGRPSGNNATYQERPRGRRQEGSRDGGRTDRDGRDSLRAERPIREENRRGGAGEGAWDREGGERNRPGVRDTRRLWPREASADNEGAQARRWRQPSPFGDGPRTGRGGSRGDDSSRRREDGGRTGVRRDRGDDEEHDASDDAYGGAEDERDEYDDDDEVDDGEHSGRSRRRTGAEDGRRGRWGDSRAGGGPPPLRDTLTGEALYGVFPVLAALRTKRRKVHRAFMLDSIDLSRRKDAGLIQQVEALCKEAAVEVVRTSRHELNLMSNDRPHQGLVLDVSPLDWTQMEEFPHADTVMAELTAAARTGRCEDNGTAGGAGDGSGAVAVPPVWLALDEVVDPQNFGAVVRSAYCLGAAGVLACSRNCAPLSPTASKASAGALEALPLHSCRNLPRTLLDARDVKGWAVLGAAAGAGSNPVGRVAVNRPTILVLGSEGFGLRTNVRRACSGLVRVDMAPAANRRTAAPSSSANPDNNTQPLLSPSEQPSRSDQPTSPPPPSAASPSRPSVQGPRGGLVDSLNVSVATGILLHSLMSSAAAGAAITSSARGVVVSDVGREHGS